METDMIKIILMIICALALFFIAVMVADNKRFVVRHYKIRSPKIAEPMRLVFIADLHERCYGNENEKLVSRIEELKREGEIDLAREYMQKANEILKRSGITEVHDRKLEDAGSTEDMTHDSTEDLKQEEK